MEIIIILAVVAVLVMAVVRLRRRRATPDTQAGTSLDPIAPGPRVPEFRVVALGPSGSGKTVLLSSMFHQLSYPTGARSYYLDTAPEDRLLLNQLHQEVADPTRPWPSATGRSTAETRQFAFDCIGRDDEGRHHTVTRISYLDFAGVLLEDPAHARSESFDRLQSAIQEAAALLVLIDGRRVLQLLDNDPEGHRHFAFTLRPTAGYAQGATCPLHFVVTKWDLIQESPSFAAMTDAARLDVVIDALMHHPHLRALVDARPRQVVRIIPVSSVGTGFAELDGGGRVVKKPEATAQPSNVDVPLAAVVPDFFRQVASTLDDDTRRTVNTELRARMRLGAGEFVSALALLAGRPAGKIVQSTIAAFTGQEYADGLYTLFLEHLGGGFTRKVATIGTFRNDVERQLAAAGAVRAAVLADFARAVNRTEDAYPGSLLSGPTRAFLP